MSTPLQVAFKHHPRQWREYFYVYPVISRRSGGLSVGVELNPDKACNFDCVYCCVNRDEPPRVRQVDLAVLEAELRQMLENRDALFDEPEFCEIPTEYRRLNDIAFSGSGEPTAAPVFPEAARLAVAVRDELGLGEARMITITDACFLTRPRVAETVDYLAERGGEVWAKLDAGTEAYFRAVTRGSHSLAHVLENILATGKRHPVVVQSLFLRLDGASPPPGEIEAYAARLAELRAAGAQLEHVQVYTVARQTASASATPLPADELERIADAVRAIGLPASVYP